MRFGTPNLIENQIPKRWATAETGNHYVDQSSHDGGNCPTAMVHTSLLGVMAFDTKTVSYPMDCWLLSYRHQTDDHKD